MHRKLAGAEKILSDLAFDKELDEKSRRRACRQLDQWCREHLFEAEAESLRLREALKDAEQGLKHTWTRIMMGQIGGKIACVELDRLITRIHSALEHSELNALPSGS